VHDYQLEELGPRAFEQLAVALARKAIGSGLQVYGSGPDGGREATYDGPIDWSSSPNKWCNTYGGPGWNGYTVVQAKQLVTALDARWASKTRTRIAQLRKHEQTAGGLRPGDAKG
jgi:hypothetical protein